MEDRLREIWASEPAQASHPGEKALAAWLCGPSAFPSTEAHLAACGPCLEVLIRMKSGRRARRAWIPLSAAAALLGVAFLWQAGREAPSSSPGPGSSSVPLRPPAPLPALGAPWVAAEGDAEVVLGDSVLAVLRKGALVRRGEDPRSLSLEGGMLLLETPGERITLKAGSLTAEMDEGRLLTERRQPPGPGWGSLSSAQAAEEDKILLRVLEGSARVSIPLEQRTLKAGESVCLEGGRLVPAEGPPDWAPPAWRDLEASCTVRDSTQILLPEAGSAYVFEALLRKRSPFAETGLVFQALGEGWEIPLGENLLPAREGWRRLRLESGPGWCRAVVGGSLLVDSPATGLGLRLLKGKAQGVGLKAWGGDLEVRRARWRTR